MGRMSTGRVVHRAAQSTGRARPPAEPGPSRASRRRRANPCGRWQWAPSWHLCTRPAARQLEAGAVVRIGPGSYADAKEWQALSPNARHAQAVWECAARAHPGQVFSHFAAAALLDSSILGEWPTTIDMCVDRTIGTRSSGLIRRHSVGLDGLDLRPWNGHFVTSPAQTGIDLAAMLPFADGVALLDQLLWARRRGGPHTVEADLHAVFDSFDRRGAARADRALAFATELSDSVRESHSRVLLDVLGFPPPTLQQRFDLPSGRIAFTDFFWPDHRHVGEYDGIGKYVDTALTAGRDAREILIEEKDREDELRRVVRAFSRWRTPATARPRLLYDILVAAGLPTSRRRPGR